jgi:hypothetical protein
MSERNLSSQFGPIIEGLGEHGIEMVPNMPGMMKVGGLHVPAPHPNLMVWTDPGKPDYHEMQVDVPDEKGNLFTVSSERSPYGKTPFWASVIDPETQDHVTVDSADQFADLYKGIGAADPEDALKFNAREMDRHQAISDYMGAGRGEWTGATNPRAASPGGWEDHVLDPLTGDSRPAAMSREAANRKWHEDQEWLKEQGR